MPDADTVHNDCHSSSAQHKASTGSRTGSIYVKSHVTAIIRKIVCKKHKHRKPKNIEGKKYHILFQTLTPEAHAAIQRARKEQVGQLVREKTSDCTQVSNVHMLNGKKW